MDQRGLTTKTILDEGITKKESGSDIQGAQGVLGIWGVGCKSKRPPVKTPPSQNVHEWVKTSPYRLKNWSKRLHKTSPFFKGDFSKKYGILTKKKLVLVSGTNV